MSTQRVLRQPGLHNQSCADKNTATRDVDPLERLDKHMWTLGLIRDAKQQQSPKGGHQDHLLLITPSERKTVTTVFEPNLKQA